MNPQDDPEARIRDLERPLADRARTSELGTQPYPVAGPYPPPPPPPLGPPAYDMPYPMAQTQPKSSHASVIVLVVVVLVLLVVGASVAIYFANLGPRDSATTAGRPVAGGGGSIDFPPDVLPTGDAPVVVLPGGPEASDDVVVQAPANGTFSVSGVKGDKRVVCNDSTISISGVSNTVTITGHCVRVTVSGVENQVTVENADTISASGFENRVVFQTGEPQINSTGDNIVERG
ncbi:DUF3060 domain-containing protein [Mycolicibacterium sp. S2-37]|uniref:DUF3060 domain-containing protein n=1 Tax=Mycolicibacterium sp. S2-37 TaxID=2810297 RepID=UPI001A94C583|nr:DUF3060 domain-containing protein [Mycolicibacterium sp. S2-37]MBO0679064.1 DUF3060 domain-containing protein [Mycolicibacterium sp. S2-37]